MDFVFKFWRKTVAPVTVAEFASTTLPVTTRCPRFCAWAAGRPPLRAMGTSPTANAAYTAAVAMLARFNFILPLLLLRRGARLRPRRVRRRCGSVPTARRRQSRIRFHTLHKRLRRLLPLRPFRYPDYFRILGRWARRPPLSDEVVSCFTFWDDDTLRPDSIRLE